ncbi:MAG: DUF4870 domain-containing protein [Bacteroidota bacterium]
MPSLRSIREAHGLTQKALAEQTKLSIRTIQRLEASQKAPKGHSLMVLAQCFGMKAIVLQEILQPRKISADEGNSILPWLNVSVLAFIGIPFGNLILPFLIWRKHRHHSQVDEWGRRILNVQVLWSLGMSVSLCFAPFLQTALAIKFPLVLLLFAGAALLNIGLVVKTAMAIQQGKDTHFALALRLV